MVFILGTPYLYLSVLRLLGMGKRTRQEGAGCTPVAPESQPIRPVFLMMNTTP